MELRQIRYFVTIAQELNFNRAAEKLSLAQPALSQQMRHLEDELGVVLFDRSHRQIGLTIPGEIFLRDAQRILTGVETATRMAQKAGRGETGSLVIGCPPIGSSLLLKISRPYRKDFPDVELTLEEMLSVDQLPALQTGQIDLGFMSGLPASDEGISWELISRQPTLLALSDNSELARSPRSPLSWPDLADQSFIMLPRHIHPQLFDQFIALCQQAGFTPHVIKEAIHLETIWSLVAAEVGVALVSAHQARVVDWQGVVYKALEEPFPHFEFYMVWRREDKSPVLQTFLESVRRFRPAD